MRCCKRVRWRLAAGTVEQARRGEARRGEALTHPHAIFSRQSTANSTQPNQHPQYPHRHRSLLATSREAGTTACAGGCCSMMLSYGGAGGGAPHAPTPSKLPTDLSLPIAAGVVYLLSCPTVGGRALPSAEDAAARSWMEQVRALLQRACGAGGGGGVAITHAVVAPECALASPVLGLLQQRLAAQGLQPAQLFHAEQAHSPRAMLDELLRGWHAEGEEEDDAAGAAAASAVRGSPASSLGDGPQSLHTPSVSSSLFRRSLRATRLPRLLLLAPGMRHDFNEALHLHMQALDPNAHCRRINEDEAHKYTSATAAAAAASAAAAAGGGVATAARASDFAVHSAASEPASDPLVACSSGVFGAALCAPVLLEYTLYRSALTGVWSSMQRLQRALEERLRQAAAAAAEAEAAASTVADAASNPRDQSARDSLATRLPGTHYPCPAADGGGPAACSFVVRHCRFYTALSSHTMHSVLLIAVDADATTAPVITAASVTTGESQGGIVPASSAPSQLQSVLSRLSSLRTLSAWSGPRTVVFDDSDAGRALATSVSAAATAASPPLPFAFRPTFLSLGSAMGAYASIVSASPFAPLLLFGPSASLEPLLSLLLNQGRRSNLSLERSAVRAIMQRERGIVDLQHCHPELPSALTTRAAMPQPLAPMGEDAQQRAARELHAHSQSRFQVSRVLSTQAATLSSLPI